MMLSRTQQLASALKLKQNSMIELMMKASICHKSELPPKNVKRWPYETTSYGWHNFFLDPFTKGKFDENTKIILIEGNIAAGKDDFGRRLANELGMHYMPDVDLEKVYINDYGYDYRALNPLLPERLRACDWSMFHENPSRHSVIHMQHYLFILRSYQYVRALRHIFNTGQGVVMNRSCFTERVFVEAMHNLGWTPHGYLRPADGIRFYDYKNKYNYSRTLMLLKLYKPHLTIYLDTPVETCLKRVRNSQDPMIAESKALIPEFFEEIKNAYEDIILPKLDNNGLVHRIDYPERFSDGEILDVVDDLKKLDFTYDPNDTRFDDWDTHDEGLWHMNRRMFYTSMKVLDIFQMADVNDYDIAGYGDSISAVDVLLRESMFEAHVIPFGYLKNFYSDFRFNNPISALFDYKNLDERCLFKLRTEYK